ncbi:unnamed protein product [Eruca vesicaria subsp. sativa]|uniref:Uncharacterized protein n=1 Tax=Eruca vesicaria subsp. sativa TaxID=29727 RepID=A0ABC8JFF2_ERUVS|nr:unnamed protein product [Eruca vesicaria subsp. sativa]
MYVGTVLIQSSLISPSAKDPCPCRIFFEEEEPHLMALPKKENRKDESNVKQLVLFGVETDGLIGMVWSVI